MADLTENIFSSLIQQENNALPISGLFSSFVDPALTNPSPANLAGEGGGSVTGAPNLMNAPSVNGNAVSDKPSTISNQESRETKELIEVVSFEKPPEYIDSEYIEPVEFYSSAEEARKAVMEDYGDRFKKNTSKETTSKTEHKSSIVHEDGKKTDADVSVTASADIKGQSETDSEIDTLSILQAAESALKSLTKSDSGRSGKMSNQITDYQLSQIFLARKNCLKIYDGIHVFNGRYYQRYDDSELKSFILEELREYIGNAGNRDIPTAVAKYIGYERKIFMSGEDVPNCFVTFNNGILDLNSGRMHVFDPRVISLYQVQANYSHGLCSPAFENFLNTAGGNNPNFNLLVKQVIGYALTPDNSGKIIVVLQGVTNSGKSVLTSVLQQLLTPEAHLVVDAHRISDNFSFEELPGKILCVCPDMTSSPISENVASKLKQLSGNDIISSDRKFRSHITFRNTAKVFLVTNHCVITRTEDNAFKDRLITIPFGVSIPREKMDINLCEKLLRERDGLVSSCIDAYLALRHDAQSRQRMGQNGNYMFNNVFNINEVVQDVLNETDSFEGMIFHFVRSSFEISPNDRVDTCDAYAVFTKEYGLDSPDLFNKLFSRYVKDIFGSHAVSCRGPKNGASNGRRGFKGIRFKDGLQF